jgi:hypothetical protein
MNLVSIISSSIRIILNYSSKSKTLSYEYYKSYILLWIDLCREVAMIQLPQHPLVVYNER